MNENLEQILIETSLIQLRDILNYHLKIKLVLQVGSFLDQAGGKIIDCLD